MNIVKNVGKRLKMIRHFSEIKQNDLANELEINAPLLSMYEQGKREPSLVFLHKFCNRFNMSLSQFFALEEQSEVVNNHPNNETIQSLNTIYSELEKLKLQSVK